MSGSPESPDRAGAAAALVQRRETPAPRSVSSLLQRVILPRPGEPSDVRSLYLMESAGNARRAQFPTRTSVILESETEVSFASYFNAFPASYWRRWSILSSVALRVDVTGTCRVDVYRSKVDGTRIAIDGAVVAVDAGGRGTAEFEIDLGPFEDGGWIWFDITADSRVEVVSAGWYAPAEAPDTNITGQVTAGIPTFNRPVDAVAALRALSSDPLVDSMIGAVVLVDQGSERVRNQAGFGDAAATLGDRFHLVEQGNLGGSGGYARIMHESLTRTDTPYVLLMDDDIDIEPESILRAFAFSRFATTPLLVGGQMLNLQERTHLHTMGEVIDRTAFVWGPAPHVTYDHDFATYPLTDQRRSRNLHRRIDVDFNGWWMCMVPRACIEAIGLPLPLFIKWDDAEYGLRARSAGYRTVSLPGTAVWHMAWSDKDDGIDWQAYFHLRNRLVAAAIHRSGPPHAMLVSMTRAVLEHLVCLEYSTVAIQIEALRDFLAGPDTLFELLPTALPKVTAMRRGYPDAMVLPSAAELASASGDSMRNHAHHPPTDPVRMAKALALCAVTNVRPTRPQHHQVPQANLSPSEARWFRLGQLDGATVTTSDGRGVVFRQRDRKTMAALLREALTLHRRLHREFPRLQQRYRVAAPALASHDTWARIFSDGD
ncbi:glycosyltransferase [Rhodococcus koreensis]